MDVEQLPDLIRHVRDGLYPAIQPLIDIIKGFPKTREVKSLDRKLRRSYSSLDDAIDIIPDVSRSLASYQPDVSFDAEEGEPNAAQLAYLQRAFNAQRKKEANRGQMAAENALARGLQQAESRQREIERMAAAARGEAVLHVDGGRRTRRRRKQKKTKKQRRYRR